MNALSPEAFTRSAVLGGPDNCFRYELRRVWDAARRLLVVCMLNPSTADHEKDDPTILALMHFARLWGYGGLLIVNLFALRSPSPKALLQREDRIGPKNSAFINAAQAYASVNGGRLLAAWGNGGSLDDRADWFCSRAYHAHRLELVCLGTTRQWAPKHPMARGKHRIPRDQRPIVWREAPEKAA